MGVNLDGPWGICVLSSEAGSLPSIVLVAHRRDEASLPSPSDNFCHLLTLREKWGEDCNQGTECKHTRTSGKPQHVVLACNYSASRLLSITCAASQGCSLHSLLNGYPNFTLFKDFKGKKQSHNSGF